MPSYIFPLSLHDALPICLLRVARVDAANLRVRVRRAEEVCVRLVRQRDVVRVLPAAHQEARIFLAPDRLADESRFDCAHGGLRSEEHTSELQSHVNLVCRPTSSLFPYTTLFRSAFFALLVSMLRIFACACGERRKYAYVWFGNATSSVYCPLPIRKRASSLRLTDWPMNPDSIAPMVDSDRKSTRLNSSHMSISYAVLHLPSFPTRRSSDLPSSRCSCRCCESSRARAASGGSMRTSGSATRRRPCIARCPSGSAHLPCA